MEMDMEMRLAFFTGPEESSECSRPSTPVQLCLELESAPSSFPARTFTLWGTEFLEDIDSDLEVSDL
jgi:hypothetical protein